jgi:lipopolysaccharide export system protein LptA
VWTSKRILLLVSGFFLFVICYGVYAYFLGGIDGLQPLPESLWPGPGTPITIEWRQPNEADQKLRQSFGGNCPEVDRKFKVNIKSRHMTFACEEFEIQPDGRVKLWPFSIALFSKDKKDGNFPEINTLRSAEAYLTLDQPISHPFEASSRKIIGAELRGDINIINNRRSLEKNDDLEVHIVEKPLYYHESKNRIWSDGWVHLLDTQSQPHPTKVQAQGMQLHLSTSDAETPANPASTARVSGVDQVVLLGNVDMYLHIDTDSKFLSGGPKAPEPVAGAADSGKARATQKSHIHISTFGPFTYDVNKDLAVFEGPPVNGVAGDRPHFPSETVRVECVHNKGDKDKEIQDELDCHRLELQFRKRSGRDGPVVREDRTAGREIQSAVAFARPGKEVTLIINSENMAAYGSKLTYVSPTKTKGAETHLVGEPMRAVKDAHQIVARELQLIEASKDGKGRYAFARGPGQIDLVDQNKLAKVHRYHALWKDSMKVVRVKEGEKEYDLMTFTTGAEFRDDTRTSNLFADQLQVWLEPSERESSTSHAENNNSFKSGSAPRQQPHKLVGSGNVRIHSPEINVKRCEFLIVHIAEGQSSFLPDQLPPVAGDSGDSKPYVANNSPPVAAPPQGDSIIPVMGGKEGKSTGQERPIEVVARKVEVFLLRTGNRNELQQVITEGDVVIHQDGKTAADKGVDIQGELVHLWHYVEGDKLIVHGSARQPALLQLEQLILVGPTVEIDQRVNITLVQGIGAMDVPSKTSLDGGPAPSPDARLKIYWNKEMFFDGKVASFSGGVVAYQDDSSLRCQTMLVTLDRSVSFKEGQKKDQGAKVENLICSKQVDVANLKRDVKGQFQQYNRLVALELHVNNQEGPARAQGPGKVYLLQHGTEEIGGKNAQPKGDQLYLTRVDFLQYMHSNKKPDNSQTITFNGNVEVFHGPTNNPFVKIDIDKLGKEWMYMNCTRLIVESIPLADGAKRQKMTAEGGVEFRSDEFSGTANKIRYDQSQEQIIFEGTAGRPAVLHRTRAQGQDSERVTAQMIIYNRKTGIFRLDGGKNFQFSGR